MFSQRTHWDLTLNRLSALTAEKRRRGASLLDLTVSNPTQAGLTAPPDLLAALADPAALRYDPSPSGLMRAREAVAADFARRGVEVEPARLVLTASTSEAYAFLFKLLADPGDAVLVPRPSYPLFEYLARLECLETAPYALLFDGEWRLDLGSVEAAFDRDPRVRALILVHPNNPTGSFVKRDQARELGEMCARRGLAVVSDEVFADFAFAGPGRAEEDVRRLPSFAAPGRALAFTLGGISKSCGLPQLKLGWIAVSGPDSLCREALARLEIIADTFLSVSTPVQVGLPQILNRLPELQRPIKERVRSNLAALLAALGSDSAVTLLPPEGGWYAVLRVPATMPEEARVVSLLAERDVLVHPRLLLRLPGRGLPGSEPAPAGGDVPRGRAPHPGNGLRAISPGRPDSARA